MPVFKKQALNTPDQVNNDVEALYKAMKGFGADKGKIITIIGNRTDGQMQQIVKAYKTAYGENLSDKLKSELSGNMESLSMALCLPLANLDAKFLRDAIKGMGTDEYSLALVLAGRTNQEILDLIAAFKQLYGKTLEEQVASEVSGKLKKLFVGLLQGARDETNTVGNVDADVDNLYAAGQGKWGTDETEFIKMFSTRGDIHLRNVFNTYKEKHGMSFKKVIEKEFSGELERMLVACVQSVENPGLFYADAFEKSMSGLGTNEQLLDYLACRFREPECMALIKAEYLKKYEKSLITRVKKDCSGDYEKLLVALLD